MSFRTCKSCGDGFDTERRRLRRERDGQPLVDGELDYCLTCADELFHDRIRIQNVNTHASGAGCPLEGGQSEDPSPWEENAVRAMEETGEAP